MAINTVKATINGIEHSLTYNNSTLKWEVLLNAPSDPSSNENGGYYNVSVVVTDSAANNITIDASHATLGPSLRLVVVKNIVLTIADKLYATVRYEVLRRGAVFAQIYAKSAPTITMVSTSELKTSLSGEFHLYNLLGINFLSDRLRPVINIKGTEYNCGIYCVTGEIEYKSGGVKTISIEAYSLLYLLQQSKIEERVYYAAGTLYTTALAEQFVEAGITSYRIGTSDLAFATDREDWEIGTTRLEIINQLLTEMSFNSAYADSDGVIICSSYAAPSLENKKHEYRAGEYSIIGPDYTRISDYHSKCNVFKITCSNPDLITPLIATSENADLNSPYNIIAVGRILHVETIDNVASQDALQLKADELRNKSLLSTETVTFSTVINPEHSVFDTVALFNDTLDGLFAETDWTMPLSAKLMMTHSGKRVLWQHD